MWDGPRPGVKPVSYGLQGGFLTTGPPGKPYMIFIACHVPVYITEIVLYMCSESYIVDKIISLGPKTCHWKSPFRET